MGESIWGPVAAHKGSGMPQLAAPGEPSHSSLVGGDAGSQPSAAAVGESGLGESGGVGGDQAVTAELPCTGKEASGSAGLASSDAIALPSAKSSWLEEEESGAREEDSAEEWEAFAGEDDDEEEELSDTSMLSNTQPAEGAVPRGLLISNDNTAPRENTRSARGQVGPERRQPSQTPVLAPQPPPPTLHQPPPPETSRSPSIASLHS
ncbi:UNVERIFIED_CONTAM: hypothetical protein FKN15_028826 [Acipenser sinensis]